MDQPQNFTRDMLTINVVKANVFGFIIFIPVIIVYFLPYLLIWGDQISFQGLKEYFRNSPLKVGVGFLLFVGISVGGAVVHELIHGVVWAFYAKGGFKSIRFGVLWKSCTPYCHCQEPLTVRQYITGGLMPGIIMGLLPGLAGIVTGNIGMLVFGMFFTIAASGDIMIINLLRKEKMDSRVLDHPSEVGCYIYRKIEN